MKMYEIVEVQIHLFLTSALVAALVFSLTPRPLFPQRESPCTHWIRGLVGPRVGLDEGRGEKSCPYRDSNSDSSAVQPVTSRYTAS
jgi:hypothetical protein